MFCWKVMVLVPEFTYFEMSSDMVMNVLVFCGEYFAGSVATTWLLTSMDTSPLLL